MNDLKELFMEARKYGRVRLTTTRNSTYYCAIEFDTIMHVTLEANSDFDNKTPEEAVKHALAKAIEIVKSISNVNFDTSSTVKLLGSFKNG